MLTQSTILIVSNIQKTIDKLLLSLPRHNTKIIKNEEDSKSEFLIAHSKKAIKEAYLASSQNKYILLCGDSFNEQAQNSLLKLIEEPPKNIIFIIITLSKNSILPTIFSRLPYKIIKDKTILKECSLNFNQLDLKTIYNFLKQNQRISKNDAKKLIESLLYKIQKQNIKLTKKQLELFSTSLKLIHLNSRPLNVLTNILLNLSHINYFKTKQLNAHI
jgi:DNA polymerase-3 subunit delta'